MKVVSLSILLMILAGCVTSQLDRSDSDVQILQEQFLSLYNQAQVTGDYATFYRACALTSDRSEVEQTIRSEGGDEGYNQRCVESDRAARLKRLADVVTSDTPMMLLDSQGDKTMAYYRFDPPIKGYNHDLDIYGYCFYREGRQWKVSTESKVQLARHKELLGLGSSMESAAYPLWLDYIEALKIKDPVAQYLLRYRLIEQGNYVAFTRSIVSGEDQEAMEQWIASEGEELLNERLKDDLEMRPLIPLAQAVRNSPAQIYQDESTQQMRAYFDYDQPIDDWVGYEFTLEGQRWVVTPYSTIGPKGRQSMIDQGILIDPGTTSKAGGKVVLKATLKGHDYAVTTLAVTPDNQTLISGSLDNTIRLWNLESGAFIKILAETEGDVEDIAIASDGRRLVYGGDGLEVMDMTTGQSVASLKKLTEDITEVAISGDGKRLFAGDMDGNIEVWDWEKRALQVTLDDHLDRINALAISLDDSLMVSGSHDGRVKLWDLKNVQLQKTLIGHRAGILAVAISPDVTLIASGSWDETIIIWEVASGQIAHSLEASDDVVALSFMQNGDQLASLTKDGTLSLWNVEDGTVLQTIDAHEGGLSMTLSPDGRNLITGGNTNDKAIKIWRLR